MVERLSRPTISTCNCRVSQTLNGRQNRRLQAENLVKYRLPSSVWPYLKRCVNLDRPTCNIAEYRLTATNSPCCAFSIDTPYVR